MSPGVMPGVTPRVMHDAKRPVTLTRVTSDAYQGG